MAAANDIGQHLESQRVCEEAVNSLLVSSLDEFTGINDVLPGGQDLDDLGLRQGIKL